MEVRFLRDVESGEPHVHRHGLTEAEVREAFDSAIEDGPGSADARVHIGWTEAGRLVRVIYAPDPAPESVFVTYPLGPAALRALRRRLQKTVMTYNANEFPPGWDEESVKRVLDYYENQTDEEAAAEDDARFYAPDRVLMEVPADLVPLVRELIAKRSAS